MDKRVVAILTKINQEGYEAYLVGGSSRDELLNIPYEDVDIATNASPNQIEQWFKVTSSKGKMFGNLKVNVDGLEAEITTFRLEKYDHHNIYPIILGYVQSCKEDAKRRDFTINALYLDKDGKVYDSFEGIKDLENKQIRFIGNPIVRIKEDPTRIIRGLRLKGKIGFDFEFNTLQAIKNDMDEILRINPTKLAKEIKKTYDEYGISKTNCLFREYGVFTSLFGYDKEFVLDTGVSIEYETILEQLKESNIRRRYEK